MTPTLTPAPVVPERPGLRAVVGRVALGEHGSGVGAVGRVQAGVHSTHGAGLAQRCGVEELRRREPAGDQALRCPVVRRGDPHPEAAEVRDGVRDRAVDVDVDQHVTVDDARAAGDRCGAVGGRRTGLGVDRTAAGCGRGQDLESAVELGDVGTGRVRGAGGGCRLEAEREESGAEQCNREEATSFHRTTVCTRAAKAPWPTRVRRRVLPRRSRRRPGPGTPCAARRRSPSAARRPSRRPRRRRR